MSREWLRLVNAMSSTNQHLSTEELERYRHGRLGPADLLAADDHLSQCDLCYGNLDGAQERTRILGLAAGTLGAAIADGVEHPASEELFDFTDGRLDEIERQTIEDHLENCSDCRIQAIELRSVSLDIASKPGRTFAPRAARPHAERAAPHWQARPAQIGLRIAAALMLAVLLAWAATLPFRAKIGRLEDENAKLKESNAEMERQGPALRDMQDQIATLRREYEALRQAELPDAAVAVSLSEPGGIITIDKEGAIHGLPPMDASDSEAIKAALVTGRVKASREIAGLRDKPGQLMGGVRAPYGLVAPVATIVAEQRPTFRWRRVDRATSYVVSVYADDSKLAARSEPLSVTEWLPAANLDRARTYTWQVRAVVDSSEVVLPPPAAPEARFKILAAATLAELDRAKQTYGGSHLMKGIAYARLGMLDDAERQLQALVNANPQSKVARKLLGNLKALRPRY